MNQFKRNIKPNCINCQDALSLIEKESNKNALYMLHEIHYPETRKDLCLVKKTFVGVQGSFDSIYIVWRTGENLNFKKVLSTSIYDPPEEQNLFIGYIYEDSRKIFVKVYPSLEFVQKPSSYNGTLHELSKEALGIK